MNYFLGIDGGGTKTAYLLVDGTGKCLAEEKTAGCSYKEIGISETAELLKKGVLRCIEDAGLEEADLTTIAVGLPCFGELKAEDILVEKEIKSKFTKCPIYITNDVEVGWAGSLGMTDGVNVVAGTGSIAFGRNRTGENARSGGWSTFFGDEGSCYWLGRRTMELFSKQADGRASKGPLYESIRKAFGLEADMDFIERMDRDYIGQRSKVASMQRYLLEASRQGDKTAQQLYEQAAHELGIMAGCILDRLWHKEQVPVSYSGGLFFAKEYVLPVFEKIVEKHNGYLVPPKLSPVQGAVLMAMDAAGNSRNIEQVRENWLKK